MYAHINDQGNVNMLRSDAPQSITLADGRTVSNPSADDIDLLAMGGWVEATGDAPPEYDPDLQTLTGPTWTVTTRQFVNDEEGADGETYTVPATATGEYTLVDREVRLETDRFEVPGDGSAFATVRYVHPGAGAPTTVDFDVNGDVTTETLVDQKATIEVEATGPGPITITAGGQSIVLTATEA